MKSLFSFLSSLFLEPISFEDSILEKEFCITTQKRKDQFAERLYGRI
jgi:hypothetical protein